MTRENLVSYAFVSKTIPSTLKILEVWLVYKSLCLRSYNIDFFPQMVLNIFSQCLQ